METILQFAIGVVCIVIGISNRKGNLSLLHSYHRNRVAEEDRLPMGKLVGLGTIIVGVTVILAAVLTLLAFTTLCNIVLVVGLAIGSGICLYAVKKYNKGLF